jgi:hypothetical protein
MFSKHNVMQTYIISDTHSPLLSRTTKKEQPGISSPIRYSTTFLLLAGTRLKRKFEGMIYELLQEHCMSTLMKIFQKFRTPFRAQIAKGV